MLARSEQQAIRRKGSGVFQFLDCYLRCVQFLWAHELHARFFKHLETQHTCCVPEELKEKGLLKETSQERGSQLPGCCITSSQDRLGLYFDSEWPSNVHISCTCWAAASYSCKSRSSTRPCTTALQLLVWYGNCIWGVCKHRLATHTISSLKLYMV